MRFDDTLETVLAGDVDSAFAAQSAWRQLVDLIGRGRAPADDRALDTLRTVRDRVPLAIRVASSRSLDHCSPPAALVRLLAADDLAVALPVLRGARLDDAAWCDLLPALTPPARSVLRNRRDLSSAVRRALDAYGPSDMALPDTGDAVSAAPALPRSDGAAGPAVERSRSFVSLGRVARDMPVVAEAVRLAASTPDAPREGPFEIADVVARIDAFQRQRDAAPAPVPSTVRPRDHFHFETDREGAIRWVEGINRAALIGLCLSLPGVSPGTGGDAIVSGALRRRAAFRDARLSIAGGSDAAGDWLLSAMPVFDPRSGRFIGYRGTGRRPMSHERADAPVARDAPFPADSMRQLVHELRTPANAISGFAEMIESELLGPVPPVYRERASAIREQAAMLVGAIDDLDLAARMEANSLDLRPQSVALSPMLTTVVGDLGNLLALRGASIAVADSDLRARGDARALERLFGRLLATVAASAGRGEVLGIMLDSVDGAIRIVIDRPAALHADMDDDPLLGENDAMPLGAEFALRLARNLARELGGSFELDTRALTLTLPAIASGEAEQAQRH